MEYFKEPANAVYQSGAKNPFLPLNIYIPDGEPKVFDGRVYLYGSKDEFDGEYCCHKFHVYSAPVSDLTEWTDHGPVLASTDEYEKEGIKKACRGQMGFYGRQMLQRKASCIISISAFQMEQRVLQKARTHTDRLRMLCR